MPVERDWEAWGCPPLARLLQLPSAPHALADQTDGARATGAAPESRVLETQREITSESLIRACSAQIANQTIIA
jgi:hypothetical protein